MSNRLPEGPAEVFQMPNRLPEGPAGVFQISNRLPEGPAEVFQISNRLPEGPPEVWLIARRGSGYSPNVAHLVSPPIIVRMRSVTPFNSASISARGRGGWKT